MFTTLIVQPIFNLLVLIYALLPGHNFGLSIIIFTIIIRLILWPLLRKQLRQAKAMRKLQPELKKIKQATKGNRQKESQMTMELYKEQGINPVGTLPTAIIQVIVLIGLYSGLHRVITNPENLVNFAYPSLRHLPWIAHLAHNHQVFDDTLLGFVNLSRSALGPAGLYVPAFIIVLGSTVAQYFQSKQLLPTSSDQRGLRAILKDAGAGKQADQSEVNAAVGRSTLYILPFTYFIFTVRLASALSLYLLTSGLVAYLQQAYILRQGEEELETIANNPTKNAATIPEAEVISDAPKKVTPKAKTKRSSKNSKAKRRKK